MTVGSASASAEEAQSVGRQNNCFALQYKDRNLIFVCIRASFKSLTGRQPRAEHTVKHDREGVEGSVAHRTPERPRGLCAQGAPTPCTQMPAQSTLSQAEMLFSFVLFHDKMF